MGISERHACSGKEDAVSHPTWPNRLLCIMLQAEEKRLRALQGPEKLSEISSEQGRYLLHLKLCSQMYLSGNRRSMAE
jgi:hypothetical protein